MRLFPAFQSRRGATAVEFALTVPILITLMAGLMEYSWYVQSLTSVTHATREGVRFGVNFAQDESPEVEAETQAKTVLKGLGLDCDAGASCSFTAQVTAGASLDVLTLSTTVTYVPIVGLVPVPENLTASTSMAMEDQPEE